MREAPVNCILVLVVAWKLSTNFGMKFLGREPNTRLYDVASAICASQGEAVVVRCLLEGVESTSVRRSRIDNCRKKEEVYVMVTVRLCQRCRHRKALKLDV